MISPILCHFPFSRYYVLLEIRDEMMRSIRVEFRGDEGIGRSIHDSKRRGLRPSCYKTLTVDMRYLFAGRIFVSWGRGYSTGDLIKQMTGRLFSDKISKIITQIQSQYLPFLSCNPCLSVIFFSEKATAQPCSEGNLWR